MAADVVMFKSLREEQEWSDPRLNKTVKEIVTELAEYAVTAHGWLPVVTSIWRSPEENEAAEAKTTIHVAWRAIDLRTIGVPKDAVDDVGDWVTKKWVYDPARPHLPVAYWAPHGTGPHIHVQAHPSSKLRQPIDPQEV